MLGKALTTAAAGNAAGEVLGVEDVFSTWLYTGNGSTQTITNGIDLAGEGGMVWLKGRSTASNNYTVFNDGGTLKDIITNSTTGAGTTSWSSWNNNGFSLSAATNNNSATTYASWTFRKAAKFFDVVTFNYAGSGNIRVSHSLGSVPGCIIIKYVGAASDWYVYHRSRGRNYYSRLNSTSAEFNVSNVWDTTDPTSTDFGISAYLLQAGTWVAYVFAHDAGGFGDSGNDSVIKCGSYVGNGVSVDVNLGWEPQWVMFKPASGGTGSWRMLDTMRGISDIAYQDARLDADLSSAESLTSYIDISATGFKATSDMADNGVTYIYIAIRRGPMKTPTDATTVFATQATAGATDGAPSANRFTSNFPVDLFFQGYKSGDSAAQLAMSRLTGDKYLSTSSTAAEASLSYFRFDDMDGIYGDVSAGADSNVCSWMFRRAPGFFDVVAYTGTGSNSQSVTHNLTVKPQLIITKKRSGSDSWYVYTDIIDGSLDFFYLNFQDGKGNTAGTVPTATTFNPYYTVDSGATHIAYLFATCPGVSKVGIYTGTGTTKQIDCGFTAGARFVLIKRTDSTGGWYVWDTARGIISGNDPYLLLNSTAAEVTSTDYIDPYSAGFEISSTAPAAINANGGSYIFLAIA